MKSFSSFVLITLFYLIFPIINPYPGGSINAHIREASTIYGIDPVLIRAVIKTESDFNPFAVSPKGAMGLMQLMPGTARDMKVANPFDPRENILGGVRYLAFLDRMFDGDIDLILAGYNAGPGKVKRLGRIPRIEETQDFVVRVKETMGIYRETQTF